MFLFDDLGGGGVGAAQRAEGNGERETELSPWNNLLMLACYYICLPLFLTLKKLTFV